MSAQLVSEMFLVELYSQGYSLLCYSNDIVSAVGPLQTCAGHAAGSEAVEGEILSTEGTTQGDPLLYVHGDVVVPLIKQLRAVVPDAKQVWFADDATAVGSLSSIFNWWQHLSSVGPMHVWIFS